MSPIILITTSVFVGLTVLGMMIRRIEDSRHPSVELVWIPVMEDQDPFLNE